MFKSRRWGVRASCLAVVSGVGVAATPQSAVGQSVQLDPINVEGQQGGSAVGSGIAPVVGYVANDTRTGSKTDTPLREIPQSITVVTAERMRDQGVTSVQDAFRYVPGVFSGAYGPDSRVDSLIVRGSQPDIYLDGMRTTNSWFNYQRVEPYTLERAEVLRGPASVLYGSTTTAGLINLISKRPQPFDLHEVGVQYGSFDRKQIQNDHTGKITADGQWLYQLIGVFRDSDYQTDYVSDDRVLVAPAVTWAPTNMTNWTLLANYQKDKTGSSTAFLPHSGTIFFNPNGQIPINRFVSQPGYDIYQTETKSIASLFEHCFNDVIKVVHNMRYQAVAGTYRTAYPDLYWAPNAPDPYLDPARRLVNRWSDVWLTDRKTFTSDSNAELKFATGPLSHKVLVGFDYRRMSETGQAGTALDVTPFDLYAPVYTGITFPTLMTTPDLVQQQAGFYVQDQVRWGQLIGVYGLRYDKAKSDIQFLEPQNDKALTGRAA